MDDLNLVHNAFEDFCKRNDRVGETNLTEKYWFTNGYLARMEEEKIKQDEFVEKVREYLVFES